KSVATCYLPDFLYFRGSLSITLITTQPSSFGPAVGVSDLRASKAFYVRSLFSLGVGLKSVAFTSSGLYRPAKVDDPLETSVAPRCDASASQRIYRSSSR